MSNRETAVVRSKESILATNKVLRNTYILLALTLSFSAIVAGLSMHVQLTPGMYLFTLVGAFGLLFLTQALRNSAWGLVTIFAFTGLLGFSLGPMLDAYIKAYSNGEELIMTALGATGIIFFALSAYTLTTRKDFSYMAGFMVAGITIVFVLAMANLFLNVTILDLIISGGFALFSSAMIMVQTSQIINGGEKNYIMATITLYVSIYNIFVSLLRILSAFSGRN